MSGEYVSSGSAKNKLNEHFNKQKVSNTKAETSTICLVDELDYLITHDENVVYNFLDWPLFENSGFIVIGISNVINLTDHMNSRFWK